MFRFEHPYMLYLLFLLPAMWLINLWLMREKTKKRQAIIDPHLYHTIVPLASRAKTWIKLSIYSLGLASYIVGIANPQFGSKSEEVKRKGADIMIALDISNSMLAEDLSRNRLDRAKRGLSQLLKRLRSDRIGIVVFAGEAFVQLPITTDYSAAQLFLENIHPDLIDNQGTDIGNAIELCLTSFDKESPTSKSIIIISDGEDHQEAAIKAAEMATDEGITIHTIGMGSENGAPIPIYSGNKRVGFKKNSQGNTVVSKLNQVMLSAIASAGNGVFVRATNAESGVNQIFEEIEKLERVEIGTKIYTEYEQRFQWFLLPALILLIIELIIPNTKSSWWQKLFASQSN